MAKYGPRHFLNRELSWLAFNERVLGEAEDRTTPLLNRLAFLSIVSSNLDEFVMVRVGGLNQARKARRKGNCPTGMTPAAQLKEVLAGMRRQVERQYACLNDELLPALEAEGVRLVAPAKLDDAQRAHLTAQFEQEIYPLLTPLGLDEARKVSAVPALTNCFLVRLENLNEPKEADRWAVVPIPPRLPRMLFLPSPESEHHVALLEQVTRMFLDRLFVGYEVRETALFRVTRDADLSVEESRDEDFVSAMAAVLVQRRESPAIRLEVSADASDLAVGFLKKHFSVLPEATFVIDGPPDLKAWFSLVNLPGLGRLRYAPFQPQPNADLGREADLFEAIRTRDILLHHPYESFDSVVRLMGESADDRNVLAIKQVLYRTSGQSPIIDALERAAASGKQVSVLVELKARFDEERNIEWARRLERAGAQVIYGVSGLKVHAKALLIVRREPDRIRRYVHLSTGNYNDVTAKLYTDLGLLTCDEDFGSDVAAFFNMITGYSQPAAWRRIVVAPLGIRRRVLHLIQREIEQAQGGRSGLIQAKINSLSDPEIIRALYDASRAGVKVRLNVRGICCLRPGLRGASENIEVVSIVDRFLEHSRVFYFRNGGDEELYLASADWMPRNLDRRIEIMFPVQAPRLKKRLIDALEIFFQDNVKGRWLNSRGSYRPARGGGRRKTRAQETFMQSAEEAARKLDEQSLREFRPLKAADEGP